ncbi:MAG TPA: hypothetical protein VGS08_01850 [Candidatus Saccharimonadales bacterium]|nr:hypothetical protein [Candidatus Saccharimonadales bacterium]
MDKDKHQVDEPDHPADEQEFQNKDVVDDSKSAADAQSVSWSASEFIAHEKSFGWYALLTLATALLAGLVYVFVHDIVSVVVIVVVAIILGMAAGRPPRELQYTVDGRGISVGVAFRPYSDFKVYALAEEGAVTAIIFLPMKRFVPPLSVYVGPDIQDRVVAVVSAHLPFDQTHSYDAVDRFIQRIRF